MMDGKTYRQLWAFAALIVFSLATYAQIIYGTKTWPSHWLLVLPTFLGDMIALTFWLDAGPLLLSFALLIPSNSTAFAAKVAMSLACLSAVINPIANSANNLELAGSALDLKTLIINSLTMLGVAIPIFFFIVLIPQISIKLLKRGN